MNCGDCKNSDKIIDLKEMYICSLTNEVVGKNTTCNKWKGGRLKNIAEIFEELERFNKKSNIALYGDEDYYLTEIIYDQNKDELYFKFD